MDLTPAVDLVAELGTGPLRLRRPVYRDGLPPCNHACPAGEPVQAWLAHAAAERYREAWEALVKDGPLPAVLGRVCYHPVPPGFPPSIISLGSATSPRFAMPSRSQAA